MRKLWSARHAVGAALLLLLLEGRAEAQPVHWDLGAEAGLMKRFTNDADASAPKPGFGPAFELHGHVALVPTLRVGAYVAYDISPASGIAAREILSGGLRLRFLPPWPGGRFRSWIFAGAGYAGAYAPSYMTTVADVNPGTPPVSVRVEGQGGGYVEVPLGIGMSYKVRKPWELFAELGTRLGFAFGGSLYDGNGAPASCATANCPLTGRPTVFPYVGQDSLAVYLSVGVSLEQ
jgi:hypothetical protein